MATQVLGSGNNNSTIDGEISQYIDQGGNDRYTLTSSIAAASIEGNLITVDDLSGGIINLPVGLEITSLRFSASGVEFTFGDNAVRFNGSPESLSVSIGGGNPINPSAGRVLTLEEFAAEFDATIPEQGVGPAIDGGTVQGDNSIGSGGGNPVPGDQFSMTVDQDFLTGTNGDDVFNAFIFDNQNTFQSGDFINGGAGDDRLVAEVGNSQNFAITTKTENLENIFFRAQTADIVDGNDNPLPEDFVQIDAQDMLGVQQWWSVDSRADLVIEDIRLGLSDTASLSQQLLTGNVNTLPKDVTFGMRSTDAAVDYRAYFDSQSLIAAPDVASNSQFRVNLMDLGTETVPFDPDIPLGQLNVDGFAFEYEGTRYELRSDAIFDAKTYPELEVAVRDALIELQASNPELAGIEVTRVIDGFQAPAFTGPGSQQSFVFGDSILLTDANGGEFVQGGFLFSDEPTGEFTLFGRLIVEDPTIASNFIETNIVLDNVGRGSIGGDIEIGGMSGTRGIEVFNVSVDRDSHVNEMSSTNNDLKIVNIESIGANGDLIINALNNVQDVNAVNFLGDLSITGVMNAGVIVPRDLNLTDTDDNGAADNVNFDYFLGQGNDTLRLTIQNETVAANTDDLDLLSREDFIFNINTAAGDDTVRLELDSITSNQYENQKDLKNVNVVTGSGDDVVSTFASRVDNSGFLGDVNISTGTGNDVIYIDDSGQREDAFKAAWAFNAQNVNLADLRGDVLSAGEFVWNSQLRVTFTGATLVGAGLTADEALAFDNGFEVTETIPTNNLFQANERDVNQALKDAINNDPVLSQLLQAVDGPDNTVVVRSLINGEFLANDLRVDIVNPGIEPSPAELNAINAALKQINGSNFPDQNAVQVQALVDAGINNISNAYEGVSLETGANDSRLAQTGADTVNFTDNVINAGADDDLIVLGTSVNGNDTVVFTGNFGDDTIVNFQQADPNSRDFLDFTSYLTTRATASGSEVSSAPIGIVNQPGNTLNANNIKVLDFVSAVDQSFDGLSAARLLQALNGTGVNPNYGNITAASASANNADSAFAAGQILGTSQTHLVLVHNTANDGEYQVYQLTSVRKAPAATDVGVFDSATLVGTIDFGNELDVATLDDVLIRFEGDLRADAINGGIVVPPPPPPVGAIEIPVGSNAPIAATPDPDLFTLDVDLARATDDNTVVSVSDFDVAADALQLNLPIASGDTTLDALNGLQDVTVSLNPFLEGGSTIVSFGPDANGDLIAITLLGVADATDVNVVVV